MAELPELAPGVDPSVEAAIRAYCGWHIAPEITETIVLDGSGNSVLSLPTLRVVSVGEVVNDGREVLNPEWSSAGFIRGCWTNKLRGVSVTFTHGYSECPAGIARLAAVLTELDKVPAGAQSQAAGPINVSYGSPLAVNLGSHDLMERVLGAYVLPVRP
ncbi:hypothetical protein [Naumannella halotolerans]|uniref:Head-to-tail adaptor n=1 Tax=Naumannella halotolerans TaxID=993414 RepID=A0A4R7J216_9ACTN|nr:hypothetical protein [Naumannella halotolerans]TDT31104.1 hypothetical protein CLV29_2517 [Naumannella halotolerans]